LDRNQSDRLAWYSLQFQHHPSPCITEEPTAEAVVQKTEELIPPKLFPRLLDLGCGDGLITKKLIERGFQAVGVTLGEINIDRAKQVHGLDIDLYEMHNLPYAPNSFDAVLCNHAFEHSYAPFILVCEIRVMLRLKGRWLINLPHYTSIHGPITYHHPSVLMPKQFNELFTHLGFNILQSETELDYYFLLEKDELTKCHSDVQRVLKARGEL
jgi:SAM-dependent methyltransferase